MYKRILVAIDGGQTSNLALSAALQMARYSGGKAILRLIHVIDAMAYFMALDPYASQSYATLNMMRDAGEKVLADGLAIVQSAGVQADTLLVDQIDARRAQSVAAQVKAWHASLVVVGTHGKKSIGRVPMGSGAEQIIRLSTCPVLVIRSAQCA